MASPMRARAVWMLARLTGSKVVLLDSWGTAQKRKSHQPRLRVVAWVGARSAKSDSSGSVSRAHVVGANSNGGNSHVAANDGEARRVGGGELHDVDGSKTEARLARQEKRELARF